MTQDSCSLYVDQNERKQGELEGSVIVVVCVISQAAQISFPPHALQRHTLEQHTGGILMKVTALAALLLSLTSIVAAQEPTIGI